MNMLETLVSVEEYLSTAYHPDVDFVDGRIEERNGGEREHGELQFRIAVLLKRQKVLVPFIETRLRVADMKFRIPDVCAYETRPAESVFTQPPVLCVEILSPEDRLHRIAKVAQDYLSMGVPTVWLLDPIGKRAYVADPVSGLHEVRERIAAAEGRVSFDLAEIFSDEELF